MAQETTESTPDAGTATSSKRFGGRLNAEALIVLFAIPVIVVVGFGTYAIWHATATLDSVEESSLAWPTIWKQIWEHVKLTFVSAFFVVVIAVPLGVLLTRGRAKVAAPVVVGIANGGQAAPSVGLIVLFAMWLGFGFRTAVIALTLYAILPVLRNTIVGLQGVDPTLVEAGRGVGMSSTAVLLRVELPLALPGDHGRRAHRARPARRHGHAGDLHQRRRSRRHPPGRHLPAALLGDRLGRGAGGPAGPAHRVARTRPRAGRPTEGSLSHAQPATDPCGPRGGVLSLVLAACSVPTAGGFVPKGQLAGPLEDVKSLDGARIAVGSKNFTENVLLGKMAIILLQSAGANPVDLTNIPGSAAARQAMLDDRIQAMWEYTGTGWITYLGHDKPIPDEEKQYVAVRDEDLEKNKLVWLKPAPMNNTYGFAITQESFDKYKISKLSEMKKVPVDERTFCVESELINRPDGLKGMLEKYDVPLGDPQGVPEDNLSTFQTGAIYDATAKGECTFGEVFTTDGRIVALDLKVLEDDRNFFPKYNVSLVLTDEVAKKYPQIADLIAPVAEKLTDEVLLQLNAEIDVEGREEADVAFEWLKKEGFVTDQ